MVLTPSTMLSLGKSVPAFNLWDISGKDVSEADFKDKDALLVMFICNHCPFVKHVRKGLAELYRDYKDKSIGIVGINSTNALPTIGERVAAVGYAGGQQLLSIVGRILGDSNERDHRVVLTDLNLRPGMAGAPVMNMGGQLIGMAVASDSRGTSQLIPSDTIWQFIKAEN